MGSPLGVLFANFYMTHIENYVLETHPDLKPKVYCRYIDDIFVVIDDPTNLPALMTCFKENSVLNFTSEVGVNHTLNFLDVRINNNNGELHTSVYNKPTNPGIYINPNSECPDSYKNSTIQALIHRTYKISSDHNTFHQSVSRLKQAFINNGYPNKSFDAVLSKYLNKISEARDPANNPETTHLIYYRNQFSNAYKTDERVMKSIISSNITCKNPSEVVKLQNYYKSRHVKTLISNNRTQTNTKTALQRSHVVYEYKCNIGECEHLNSSYIGMTATTLSRRLTLHLQSGAPRDHTRRYHGTTLTRDVIVANTKILMAEQDQYRLPILEAAFIQCLKPSINNQHTGIQRTLKLHSFHNPNRTNSSAQNDQEGGIGPARPSEFLC